MTLLKFGASILMVCLAGCATSSRYEPPPVPASAMTLDDGQIHSTLVGKQFYGTTRQGSHPYSIRFLADGIDVFEMAPDAPEKERWTLKDGVVCVIPNKYPTECSQVKVANNEYWFVDPKSGRVNAHLKLAP
jgi:hypothetical protein